MSRDYEARARSLARSPRESGKCREVGRVECVCVCAKVENVLIRRGEGGVGETVGGRW